MIEADVMKPELQKKLRAKNVALAVVLVALVVLFYAITVVRMGGQ